MPLKADITIADGATPALRRIAEQIKNPVALYKDVGNAVADLLREHYIAKDAKPNKKRGERSHFWASMSRTVTDAVATSAGATLTVGDHVTPLAGHLFGAIIRPRSKEALTIPIHQLAYGRSVAEFKDEIGPLFRPKGKRILMADIGGTAVPIYALAKSATIPKDPDALPADTVIEKTLLDTGSRHLARMLARG